MWTVKELTADLGWPFEVREDDDFAELWCAEHGLIAVGVAPAVERRELVAYAERHRRVFHCGDA